MEISPSWFAGRTVRTVRRIGSSLVEEFTMITNESDDVEWWLNYIGGYKSVVFDDKEFEPSPKVGIPATVYRREWQRGVDSELDRELLNRFDQLARSRQRAKLGLGGALDMRSVEIDQGRRNESYARNSVPMRPDDPWTDAEVAYQDYSGYVVLETDDRWIEAVYYGVTPAFPQEEETAPARAAAYLQREVSATGGRVLMSGGPFRTARAQNGDGVRGPWSNSFGATTRLARGLTIIHPELSTEITSELGL